MTPTEKPKPTRAEIRAKAEADRQAAKDAAEKIAENIEALSKIGDQLRSSRLTRRAQILLLAEMTHVSRGDIERILDALPRLAAVWLR